MTPRGRVFVLVVAAAALSVVAVAVAVFALSDDESACTETMDPLDPGSLQHVLPDSPPPSYITDPPTSGPHQAGGLPGGVLTEPVPRPVQVGALEAGQVLIQYRPGIDVERLVPFAGPEVVVAPNPSLPARVVATAWRRTLRCDSIDVDKLRPFVASGVGTPQHP